MMSIPACGVIDKALKAKIPDSVLRFRIWLLLHSSHLNGEKIAEKLIKETQINDKEISK